MAAILSFITAHASLDGVLAILAALGMAVAGLFHLKARSAKQRADAADNRAAEAQATVAAMKRVNDAVEKVEKQQRQEERDAPHDDGRTGLDDDWAK